MKGRTPTASERKYMELVGKLPCIACFKDGNENYHISLHHVDGRTKPHAHKKVIPLCAQHHQHDDTDIIGRIGVHPYKRRFEDRYGSSESLVKEVNEVVVSDLLNAADTL